MMETATATKSNLQIVQQAFEDFSHGNIPALIDACTDDIQWGSYDNPDVPYAGMFHGKDGAMKFFSLLGDNVDYSYFAPKEFISQGDTIIALGHNTGTVKKTGKTFDHDWCFHFKLKNGKVSYFFAFVDTRDQAQANK